MRPTAFDVICLMCGFQTGHLSGASYQPNPGCGAPANGGERRNVRCCRCGGSVYLEANEQLTHDALLLEAQHRASA
jgi:hypothetical protein